VTTSPASAGASNRPLLGSGATTAVASTWYRQCAVRVEQGTFQPSDALPIVLPPEKDELISSRLDRIARFYGLSLVGLFVEYLGASHPIEAISAVDLGTSRRARIPVARLLGLSVEALAGHTILGTYPWATELVSQARVLPGSDRWPSLRYAACPLCLEQQRAYRGFSWLQSDWVLAPRTVCPARHAVLVEMEEGSPLHPIWRDFLRRYELEAQPACTSGSVIVGNADQDDLAMDWAQEDPLYQFMAGIQDAIVARAMPHAVANRRSNLENLRIVVSDLVWAFTRTDAIYGDRLIYDAFASHGLDNPWHVARRCCPGPVAFRNLCLEVRHRMLATTTALAGPSSLRAKIFGPDRTWNEDVASLHYRLVPNDRTEFVERQKHWVVCVEPRK